MSDHTKRLAENVVGSLIDPMAQAFVRVLDKQGLTVVSKEDAALIGPAKMWAEELEKGWRGELSNDPR